jgi:shikimate dehydrogenase
MCAFPVKAHDPMTDGERILEAMTVLGIEGLAVTTPHKEVVAQALRLRGAYFVDPAAQALSSVNTLVRQASDPAFPEVFGASTDGAGFVAAMLAAGVSLEKIRVAIVGAGAAARSVIDALHRAEVADIAIINRSEQPAEAAARLSPRARVATATDICDAELVINATSVGMGSDDLSIPVELLRAHQVVTDLIYHPLETRLLREARQIGAQVVDGLGMLIHQAALQQRLWTGNDPDLTAMRMAAETELSSAGR